MANITQRVEGSNAPIRLTARAIDENGDNVVVNLSSIGATGFTANARNIVTDQVVSFASASATNAAQGEITLQYNTNSFAVGRYAVQVRFTDSAGRVHVYPYDANSAILIIGDAN